MRNFNDLTALNHRLQQDKQAVGEQRKEALRRKYLRWCRATRRAATWRIVRNAALDVALIVAMLMAAVDLLACVVG